MATERKWSSHLEQPDRLTFREVNLANGHLWSPGRVWISPGQWERRRPVCDRGLPRSYVVQEQPPVGENQRLAWDSGELSAVEQTETTGQLGIRGQIDSTFASWTPKAFDLHNRGVHPGYTRLMDAFSGTRCHPRERSVRSRNPLPLPGFPLQVPSVQWFWCAVVRPGWCRAEHAYFATRTRHFS